MSLAGFSQRIRLAPILTDRYRTAGLSALLFFTFLVYFIGLVRPYNLFTLGITPLLNIATLTRADPLAQAGFVLTFAILSALYYLAWRLCRGVGNRSLWVALAAGILSVNSAMIWLYPIDAADLFDNIDRGRITAVHGGNPFYDTPADYPHDPFYAFTAWRRSASAYGPGWELLAAATSRVAGQDSLAHIVAFKLIGVVFYAGCLLAIAAALHRRAPERALQGVCLFALNPLVIYETAGNGHNDIVMAFFVTLGAYAMARDRFGLAALAVTAGALIKFVSILILPVALAAGLRSRSGWKARLSFLLVTLVACLILVAASYAPFWKGGDPLGMDRRQFLFTASLPAVVQAQLEAPAGVAESRRVVQQAALGFTGLAVAAAVWLAWVETPSSTPTPSQNYTASVAGPEGGAWLAPLRASAFVLLFYLLFACPWFQPWYTVWPLALAAILPEGETGRMAVLLSYAAVWRTVIFDFFLYRGGPLPPRTWRETWLGPATLGIPWIYGLYALSLKIRFNKLMKSTTGRRPS